MLGYIAATCPSLGRVQLSRLDACRRCFRLPGISALLDFARARVLWPWSASTEAALQSIAYLVLTEPQTLPRLFDEFVEELKLKGAEVC